jgi:hypothetical protein
MGNLSFILRAVWVLIVALQLIVLVTMTARGLFRDLSTLYVYICLELFETPIIYAVYTLFGYQSWTSYYTAWTFQAVTVAARWLVVCQLCYLILGRFRGVWNFSLAILGTCAGTVLILAFAVGGHDFVRIVNTFDLALELSIATTLAVFFAFARYYKISIVPALRSVGIALCLYSCFRALNDAVLQKLLREYANTWSLFDEITYVATLVLIAVAVFLLHRLPAQNVRLLPAHAYASFVPQANERLSSLNDRLGQMLRMKGPR